jgi:hypothetical protein
MFTAAFSSTPQLSISMFALYYANFDFSLQAFSRFPGVSDHEVGAFEHTLTHTLHSRPDLA